ncbi:MAG: Protein OS-9 [Chaenotheca gracillima]|nr:MAG: Protein OS-9 [Chaenotheca gracillima]
MGFLGVYNAIYDYIPQGDQELAIQEGDLLFVIDKSSDDGWWNAKKKAPGEEEDEPTGLIPNNYVQEAKPTHRARALFDYTRQTDEELSFNEDSSLQVYDTSDPDWTLVGLSGEYGFVPANYIELSEGSDEVEQRSPSPLQKSELETDRPLTPTSAESTTRSPAAALAGILSSKGSSSAAPQSSAVPAPSSRRPVYTPEASDEDTPSPPAPSLPTRPVSQQVSSPPLNGARSPASPGVVASPPYNRQARHADDDDDNLKSPGGFHLYNISEMIDFIGKKKKLPTTLGINIATGTIMIAPAKSSDGPQQEWTAEKLTHYSIEGKHVFMELVRPSKSADFHAGAKDTAEEIVSALGEMAGAVRAEGLREVLAAGSGSAATQKKGYMLYEFMAQGDDEVTVAVDDEVIILDDNKSDDWWMVRRLRNGKEGVVPSSYVEITGVVETTPSPAVTGLNAGRSTVEQNRLEEQRLAKAASKSKRGRRESDPSRAEVGPGMRLPERGSSLHGNSQPSRSKRDRTDGKGPSKPRPESGRTRTWTDRSGSFKVDAAYLGCTDGKIHLHKTNGVKIAVPVVKMSVEDLEYVERITGMSLDEDKPLSDIKRRSQMSKETPPPTISKDAPKTSEFDWFDFFLQCGVPVHQCERYASNFTRDSMDEAILPEISPNVLRTLGLKEGDILRVMKFLDTKFGRGDSRAKRNVSFGGAEVMGNGEGIPEDGATSPTAGGGLFSGPGGTLRNNTRKGRPAPAVQTNDTVDPKAFERKDPRKDSKPEGTPTPLTGVPAPITKQKAGFDDDAWDVKPSKQSQAPTATPSGPFSSASPPPPQQPALTGAMQELSLLSPPLQPTVAHVTGQQQQPLSQQPSQPQQGQPTGPTPSFFDQLSKQPTATQQNFSQQISPTPPAGTSQPAYGMQPQQSGIQANAVSRQRPQAPQPTGQSQGSLMPPPPARPLSAPQNVSQQSNFAPPPLQPHLTGAMYNTNSQQQQIAPPGQSMSEIRYQQTSQQQQLQNQPTGFAPQMAGMPGQNQGFGPYGNQGNFAQPNQGPFNPQPIQQYPNGTGSPFANPGQQQQPNGGFQPLQSQGGSQQFSPSSYQQPVQTGGINAGLPPPIQPQSTGFGGFGQNYGPSPPPPPPPIPQQNTVAPLQPQKTGPAPPIRFGVTADTKKLTPQPTGRRANLSQATPQNPFGF